MKKSVRGFFQIQSKNIFLVNFFFRREFKKTDLCKGRIAFSSLYRNTTEIQAKIRKSIDLEAQKELEGESGHF